MSGATGGRPLPSGGQQRRKPTSTSAFGVSRRESHDASAFYSRFTLPEISNDEAVRSPSELDITVCADSREMTRVEPASVALVVTSPPYFAGKEYETALGEGHVPSSYMDYLGMLTEVFAECRDKLEPGGRIAVNIANLGRKPYRSLAADVIAILQDRLGLLLRGEVIWQKAQGASGSCAWGSFQSAHNPVLRDLTERIVVASKGRFDRAKTRSARRKEGLPWEDSIFKDDFMEATTDLWDMLPESASRVGHPAPFPVELPQRLIELYTYRGDLVLDPFLGSGSTAVAAIRTGRHYVGYDTDPKYIEIANKRITEERARLEGAEAQPLFRRAEPLVPEPADDDEPFQSRAVREGRRAKEIAQAILLDCGFVDVKENVTVKPGVEINLSARDARGKTWYFDVSGAFTTTRAGLRRTDTLWKALGRAAVLQSVSTRDYRLVLLSTDLPPKGSTGDAALRAAKGKVFHDAIEMLSAEGQERLAAYAKADPDF